MEIIVPIKQVPETSNVKMDPKTGTMIRDGVVLVSDRAFAGSDSWSTSYTLAQAIKQMGRFDLIVAGERATDGDTGQVGPGIAAWLDVPLATCVAAIKRVAPDEGRLTVERLVEEGYQVLLLARLQADGEAHPPRTALENEIGPRCHTSAR